MSHKNIPKISHKSCFFYASLATISSFANIDRPVMCKKIAVTCKT